MVVDRSSSAVTCSEKRGDGNYRHVPVLIVRPYRLQELTVCSEDTVDVHDIELIQYINVDCSKLKRLLQGLFQHLYLGE